MFSYFDETDELAKPLVPVSWLWVSSKVTETRIPAISRDVYILLIGTSIADGQIRGSFQAVAFLFAASSIFLSTRISLWTSVTRSSKRARSNQTSTYRSVILTLNVYDWHSTALFPCVYISVFIVLNKKRKKENAWSQEDRAVKYRSHGFRINTDERADECIGFFSAANLLL